MTGNADGARKRLLLAVEEAAQSERKETLRKNLMRWILVGDVSVSEYVCMHVYVFS